MAAERSAGAGGAGLVTAGIDAGIAYTKVVILKDGAVVGRGIGPTGGVDRRERIEEAYQRALEDAGLDAGEVKGVVVTGKGKHDAGFAGKRISELLATKRAVERMSPGATCLVSAGADETIVSASAGEGGAGEYAFNQKCSAGLGLFLEYMADRLSMDIGELSSLADGVAAPEASQAAEGVAIPEAAKAGEAAVNEGCVVFAELDALSLLNHGVSPADVGRAVNRAAAARVSAVINDITYPSADRVVLVGGLAKNNAFVRALETLSGIKLTVPDDAEYAGALGAALAAADSAQ
ncbi:MAG: acyl-CoA dehydratase activase [Clostridiales bacterium]|nr:acyl-CoA dehydratase activase [Clostridiales bacterium]